MSRQREYRIALMALAMLLASAAWGQQTLIATPEPSGLVRVSRGEVELAAIELNAHGPGWQHAPQTSATAEAIDLPDQAGLRFVGSLPVPNTDNGVIRYTETVRSLPQGLQFEYDVTMDGAMKLNGLQLSVNLPVAQYAGREVLASEPRGEPQLAGLPQEQQEANFQVWSGQAARIEVAQGTDLAVTIELRASTDVIIQDLRQWDSQVFEIRLPAIMEGEGRDVAAGDRFHLDLTVSFAGPVTLAGL